MALSVITPVARDFKVFRVSANGLAAGVIGAVAFFALLGASLRVLRFDIVSMFSKVRVAAAVAMPNW